MSTPKLSKRAIALLRRLYRGAWYPTFDKAPPAAMKELLDAGLVVSGGRVKTIIAAFVPKGTKAFELEAIPKEPQWLKAAK